MLNFNYIEFFSLIGSQSNSNGSCLMFATAPYAFRLASNSNIISICIKGPLSTIYYEEFNPVAASSISKEHGDR